jgi:hypothetical protein
MRALLVKYSAFGDTIWTKVYDNPFILGDFIRPDDMLLSSDNNFYLSNSTRQNSQADITIMKIDSAGSLIWTNTYGEPHWDDLSPRMFLTTNNDLLLSWGQTNLGSGTFFIQKARSRLSWLSLIDGVATHNYVTDTSNQSLIYSGIALIEKGNNYFIGSVFGTQSPNSNNVFGNAYIYKLGNNQNWLWGKMIANHPPSYISDIRKLLEADDGNILAIGTRPVNDSSHFMGYMQKLTPNGDSLWQRTFAALTTTAARNEIYDARPTSDGGYIICGESRSYLPTTEPMQQGWLLKVDSMGCLVPGCHITAVEEIEGRELLQIKTYPNPATDYLNVYVPAIISSSDLQLHLYNLEGKLLQNHFLPQQDATYMMQVDDLVTGVYLLQLLDEDGRLLGSAKVIVQN